MIVEYRRNGQIIIPKRIAYGLGLEEGDRLEVFVEDGLIKFVPAGKPAQQAPRPGRGQDGRF